MSSQLPKPVRLAPGQILNDRYVIETLLGTGGMAAIYLAQDQIIDRPVAVKVLSLLALIQDPDEHRLMLERFEREAKVAARIRHANAVTIFDMGITDGFAQPFIIMDYIDGHDLDEEIRLNGAMAPSRALPLFCRCLEALAEGHRLGIVHKDLKPSNLMLNAPNTKHEDLLILDFGVAGWQGDTARLTSTGHILGTPQYLAPEYIQDRLISPALDVYQMGLILIEMLTGEPVIKTSNPMRSLMTHVQNKLELPEELMAGPLGPILRRALAFEHTERYPDAEAFLLALTTNDEVAGWVSHGVSMPEMAAIPAAPVASDPPDWTIESFTAEPEPKVEAQPPPSGPPRALIVAAAIFLVISVAFAVVAGLSYLDKAPPDSPSVAAEDAPRGDTPTTRETDKNAKTAEADPVEPPKDAPKAAEDAPKVAENPQDTLAPPPSEPIAVRILTQPPGAKVAVGGQPLDQSMLTFKDGDAAGVEVKITSEGFAPKILTVSAQDGPELTVELARRTAPRKNHDKTPAPDSPKKGRHPAIADDTPAKKAHPAIAD